MAATTWNPSDAAPNYAFTNTNLTALGGGSANGKAANVVRATNSQSSGKWYFEITLGSTVTTNTGVGICNSSQVLNPANGLGQGPGASSSFAVCAYQGSILFNSAAVDSGSFEFGAGDVIGVAVDIGNSKIWIKNITDNGGWNGGGTPNPGTATGGITYSLSGGIFPMLTILSTGNTSEGGTINATDGTFVGTIPSGFTAWDRPTIFSGTVSESVTLADAPTNTGTFGVTASESVTLSDAESAAAPGLGTIWNSSDSATHITLSNGNLTAKGSGVSNSQAINGIRASASHAAGKYYFEVALVGVDTNTGIAIANSTQSLSSATGGDSPGAAHNLAICAYTSGLFFNGSTIGSFVLAGTAATYAIAVDLSNELFWIKNLTSAGNWNNSGTANPATGAGGASFSGVVGPFFPLLNITNTAHTTEGGTGHFADDGGFTGTIPSGFNAWDVPTTYNVSASESLSLSDSPSAAAIFASAASESVTLSDADNGMQTYDDEVTESDIDLEDDTDGATEVDDSVSESITLADDPDSSENIFNVTQTESLVLADSPTAGGTFSEETDESLSLTDESPGGVAYDEEVDEAITIDDTADCPPIWRVSTTETINLADAIGTDLPLTISGTTVDQDGQIIPFATVKCFRTIDDRFEAQTVSDENGQFTVSCSVGNHYIVAFRAGTPDLSGATDNNIIGS